MNPTTSLRSLLLIAIAGLAACSTITPTPSAPPAPEPDVAANGNPFAKTRQLVIVSTPGWDSSRGELTRYERVGNRWQRFGETTVVSLGRNGVAWGLGLHPMPQPGPQKHEGDGRSPAGIFRLPGAFGYGPTGHSLMPYEAMDATDWCIDVPDSPFYNRIIDARDEGDAAVAGSTEPMRLDLHNAGDVRYALGLRVAHNPQAIPGQGSCIFMHLWREPNEATAGCTAMDEATMQTLLGWLDPRLAPMLVLLPESEYHRLATTWQLPTLYVLQ